MKKSGLENCRDNRGEALKTREAGWIKRPGISDKRGGPHQPQKKQGKIKGVVGTRGRQAGGRRSSNSPDFGLAVAEFGESVRGRE